MEPKRLSEDSSKLRVQHPARTLGRRRLPTVASAIAAAAVGLFAVAGCGALDHIPHAYAPAAEQVSLPQLEAAAKFREDVARTEYSIETRSAALAALATECSTCKETLIDAGADAGARLDLVGGLWEQWADEDGQPLASLTATVMLSDLEAPYDVENLAGYMAATAESQLDWAGQGALSPEETVAMAGILTARYASALRLADTFGFDLLRAADQLASQPHFVNVSTNLSYVDEDDQRHSDPDANLGQSQSGITSGVEGALQAEEVLVAWDCLRVGFLTSPDTALTPDLKIRISTVLEARVSDLLRLGVEDVRPLRCSVTSPSLEDLLYDLVQQDALLLRTQDPIIRELAVRAVTEDITLWNEVAPKSLPLISVFPTASSALSDEVDDA